MGTNENSKNILISHDITSEEKKRKDKKKMKNKREWIDPLTRKLEGVNKSEKN